MSTVISVYPVEIWNIPFSAVVPLTFTVAPELSGITVSRYLPSGTLLSIALSFSSKLSSESGIPSIVMLFASALPASDEPSANLTTTRLPEPLKVTGITRVSSPLS